MEIKPIKIKTPKAVRLIGPGQPCFIVAEMSGNHNQDIKRAYKIIDAAARVGADAIKLQTYTPETITINCDNKYFKIKTNIWRGRTLYDLYNESYMPWDWQPKLKKYAEKKGLICFSTPFDETAVDFLEKMKVSVYKVASFEIVDQGLLKRIGRTKKPVIISRGLALAEEIRQAVKTLKRAGCPQVAVLHCVSSYPALPEEMNLSTIPDIAKKFKVITGLSDHTTGTTVAVTALALGVKIIEKHFTLKRAAGGPDAKFSMEPDEFKSMVAAVREAEVAIGKPEFKTGKKELANKIFRRSLFVVKDIKKGERLTRSNVKSIRPGYGLLPKYLNNVLGRIAKKNLAKGTPLSWRVIK